MQFLVMEKSKSSASNRLLLLLVTVAILSFSVGAQKKATGRQQILDQGAAPSITEAISATQCQDGSAAAPVACSGAAYKTGSLNRNNSHYVEGNSIPYQIILTAPAGSTGNTVQLNWETTKGGIHAFDYLTSYNRTESTGNNPCTGTGADCSTVNTFPIPADTDPLIVKNQIAGVFTIFGGAITAVGSYVTTGDPAGASVRSIQITYTMGNTGTAVLAVGGHVSTRQDWGAGFGAVNIQGAPFHFIAGSGGNGNQLSVTVGAVTAAAVIRVVKLVHNSNGTQSSSVSFPFTSSGASSPLPANFSLVDSDTTQTGGGVIAAPTSNFGTAFTVTESAPTLPNGYSFSQGGCAVDGAGFPVTSTATSNISLADRTATITLGEGNVVTCTFENVGGSTTAAKVNVSGRVTFADGRGISGARVMLTDASGNPRRAITNRLGYYTFNEVEAGQAYVMSASARQISFTSKLIAVVDELGNVDFVGN